MRTASYFVHVCYVVFTLSVELYNLLGLNSVLDSRFGQFAANIRLADAQKASIVYMNIHRSIKRKHRGNNETEH